MVTSVSSDAVSAKLVAAALISPAPIDELFCGRDGRLVACGRRTDGELGAGGFNIRTADDVDGALLCTQRTTATVVKVSLSSIWEPQEFLLVVDAIPR